MNTRTKGILSPTRLPIIGDQKQGNFSPHLGPNRRPLKEEQGSHNFAKVWGSFCKKTLELPKANFEINFQPKGHPHFDLPFPFSAKKFRNPKPKRIRESTKPKTESISFLCTLTG